MRSIFFRIYMGMLIAIMLISLVVAISTYSLSKHRISNHINNNYNGTFQLISEGVARHNGDEQQQWLNAIARLSDLEFKKYAFKERKLTNTQIGILLRDEFLYQVEPSLSTSKVFILLPDKQSYLSVQLKDYGSSLIRISAFLMLNELGRHDKTTRLTALEKLRTLFPYPILLSKLENLPISNNYIRTIKQGDIATALTVSGSKTPTFKAYAPIGNSNYVLVLGDIPFFDWFPLWLIIVMSLVVLILMAAASFYLVRPLEKRLAEVDNKIELIAQDKEITQTQPKAHDAISQLTDTVNAMAVRIHKLIDAQNDMVRAISHELRAPITRIRFQIAAIEQQLASDKEIIGIENNLEELETLIDEVLTFSKLKKDKPDLAFGKVNIVDFLNELLGKHYTNKHKITLNIDNNQTTNILADKKYLQRAISNLIINATKYATKHIQISFYYDIDNYVITVEDDGPGIPFDERKEVFMPFKRLDVSRDRQTGGYGLGLAIVQQVSKWHGGTVKISDSELGGAKFNFIWPSSYAQLQLESIT